MPPRKTTTIKNKFAAPKRSQEDGVVKRRKTKTGTGTPLSKQVTGSGVKGLQDRGKNANKKKKKTYTDAELGIPKLNSIVPVGAVKPKGVKKGKVFVDDPESMRTILAIVQADREGQIESKMIKARQMEEIREARKAEAEKKELERRGKLEDVKDSLRKKRKGAKHGGEKDEKKMKVWESAAGTKAAKTPKKKKSVSFA